ncbi:C10 family peptidase [Dyadobacter luticola]|uniref:Spi protease inhibitor domain-containing protein n=1 Tax=Dyadobacter luticola TaxID=1979387 RepID=A0A5R9L681_9BACT|nr:C10 family peptidase [Dyadobacter luticola]TLV03921.1 hypothetical protein FEN17_10145 [Dyadobacter luticola]
MKILKSLPSTFLCVMIFLTFIQCQDQPVKNESISKPDDYLIESSQAQYVARSFLAITEANSGIRNGRTSAVQGSLKEIIETKTIYDRNGNPAMYLISFGKRIGGNEVLKDGFVIVAADKRIRPILAKSDSGYFDLETDNPGIKIWLEYVTSAIADAKRNQPKPSGGADILWDQYLLDKNDGLINGRTEDCTDPPCPGDPCPQDYFYQSAILTTTDWHQFGPYNMFCPTSNNASCGACKISSAGCGAVAAAQVMNVYHKPATYTIAPAGPVNYVYPLQNSFANVCTSANVRAREIAALIRAAGMWENMHYAFNKCNSYCLREDIKNAFASAGYSNAGKRVSWLSNYATVNSELTGGHPVIMDATTKFLGFGDWHIWVIDGYQNYITYHKSDPQNPMSSCLGTEYAYYHMNWGWNGIVDDTWYGMNNFTVDGVKYDFDMNVTLGMRP